MRNLPIIINIAMLFILTSCATTVLTFEDYCEEETMSFITIENTTNDASMDLYIDGFYLSTIAPGGQYFLDNVKVGEHEIEGRESNGIRLWIRTLTIEKPCEDIFVELGIDKNRKNIIR